MIQVPGGGEGVSLFGMMLIYSAQAKLSRQGVRLFGKVLVYSGHGKVVLTRGEFIRHGVGLFGAG